MNQAEVQQQFSGLSPEQQLRVLATFGHNLTIGARDTYELNGTGLRAPDRLRVINEIQHRVLAHIRALSINDEKRYPDDVLLSILFEYGDNHLRAQTLWAFENALTQEAA